MKKLLILEILILLISECFLFLHDSPLKIVIKYDGEYYIFMENEIENNELYIYVTYGEKQTVWLYNEIKHHLGGSPNKLTIKGIKVLGETYPDYGNLIVKLKENDEILIENIAPKGNQEAIVFYRF